MNPYVKDENLFLPFMEYPAGKITIQKFQKNNKLVKMLDIEGDLIKDSVPWVGKSLFPVPDQNDSYYLLAARSVFPTNPGEFIFDFASGGHGIYYVKPILAEVRDGKVGKPQKLKYGGKRDETFYIKEVVQSKDLVHFLGLRQQEKRAWGPREINFTPVILHHASYNLKKKKVTQTNPIYTDTPRSDKDTHTEYAYMDISMDALDDNVFVAFSWVKRNYQTIPPYGVKYAESNIFYWDCVQDKVTKAEKIADGFNPVVRADSLGNVHLLYVNSKANLMHKVKRKGAWQQANVLVNRVDTKPYTDSIAAGFDKNNNLHVVYPSGDNLIHAVLKVN